MAPVFFYGLFMDPVFLMEQGYHPGNVRLGYVDNYQVRIGDKATMVPCKGRCVYGSLMTLSQREQVALYQQPGVTEYVPVDINVCILDAEPAEIARARTFILPLQKVSKRNLLTNQSYVEKLCETARRLNLPPHYIAELSSLLES